MKPTSLIASILLLLLLLPVCSLGAKPTPEDPDQMVSLNKPKGPVGYLQFTGKVYSLTFAEVGRNPRPLIMPPPSIPLSVGEYQIRDISVGRFEDGSIYQSYLMPPLIFTIHENHITTVTAGGTLTANVEAKRAGSVLKIFYVLRDANRSSSYRPSEAGAYDSKDKLPKFDVYKGDKRIASGTFTPT